MRSVVVPALLLATPVHAGFDLNRFFIGATHGSGYIDPAIGGTDRFRVSTRGRGSGRRVRMRETFRYADGKRRVQDWTIRKRGPDYVATRPDLAGPTRLRRRGPHSYTYKWRQWFDWPKRENLITVRGRLTRVNGRTVVNRAVAYKGILPVASIRVTFRRAR